MKRNKNKQKEKKIEFIYGAHSIIECLKAGKRKLYSIYTTKHLPKSYKRIEKYLPKKISNIQYVSKDVLNRMAGTKEHMGIIALVSPFKYSSKIFDFKKNKFVLLLDGVSDVHNLGAILRSAYCIGVDKIILCKKGGASVNAAAHKASAGLVEHLNISIVPSIEYAISELNKAGYNLYLAVLDKNAKDATKINYKKPICLVIGNEEKGISKSVYNKGTLITLPQSSKDISYNASVAAGILMFLLGQK